VIASICHLVLRKWREKVSKKAGDYELRSRKDKRGADLISDVLSFGGCFMAIQTLSPTQSNTQSFSAGHISQCFTAVAFY